MMLLSTGVIDGEGDCVLETEEVLLVVGVTDIVDESVPRVDLVGVGVPDREIDCEIDLLLDGVSEADLDLDGVGIGVDDPDIVFVVVVVGVSAVVPDNDLEGVRVGLLESLTVGVTDLELV